MSTSLMISMLDQAQTGAEMLMILDTFVNETVDNDTLSQPSLEEIEF